MATESHSVEFAGGNLPGQRHICAFFNGPDEEYRVLRSFYKDGFDRGDKAFHLVNPELREEHPRQHAEALLNIYKAVYRGLLEERTWQVPPLLDGQLAVIRCLASALP